MRDQYTKMESKLNNITWFYKIYKEERGLLRVGGQSPERWPSYMRLFWCYKLIQLFACKMYAKFI